MHNQGSNKPRSVPSFVWRRLNALISYNAVRESITVSRAESSHHKHFFNKKKKPNHKPFTQWKRSGKKEIPHCYKVVGRANSYEEQTNLSSCTNFQQNLLSELQACLKGKLDICISWDIQVTFKRCSQHRGFTTTIWHFQLEQFLNTDFLSAHDSTASMSWKNCYRL